MALKVSRILHAGYALECEGTQILFDPIFENPFSRNCHAFPSAGFDLAAIRSLRPAAVFISHFHDDHCSLESLALLDRGTPIHLYCLFDELFDMIRSLGFTDVRPLDLNVPVLVGPFEVIPRRALDADVDSLFQIRAEGLEILNVVDSWIDEPTLERLARFAPWDLVLWPFQTMREIEVVAPRGVKPAPARVPDEWIEQLRRLAPRFVVPSSCQFRMESWSWYNHAFFPISYEGFRRDVEGALPGVRVVRMDPSVSFELTKDGLKDSPRLSWVLLADENRVDYEYRPNLPPPSTGEIARHLPALTSVEREVVRDYCRSGLGDRFRELPPAEEGYFLEPRIWRLSVYDHGGAAEHFNYVVSTGALAVAGTDIGRPDWTTEVPAFKLHAALKDGEALTSMYVRLNDAEFPPEIEAKVRSAEITEDPLIRCLFEGHFGAYQRAQLRKLTQI